MFDAQELMADAQVSGVGAERPQVQGERPPIAWSMGGPAPSIEVFNLSRLSKHEVVEIPMRCQQSCQVPASIKHPRLHGVLRKAKNLGDLFDRLLVVVNEVNDFVVIRRHLCNTAAELRASVGVKNRCSGVSASSATVFIASSSSCGSRRRPSAVSALNRAIESIQVETCERFFFGAISVRPKTDDEVVNAKVMPSIQRPHGGLAACRNRSDKIFVGLPVGRMKICCLPADQGMLGSHFPLAAPIRSGAPSAHTN
jgi:hypothetical protein